MANVNFNDTISGTLYIVLTIFVGILNHQISLVTTVIKYDFLSNPAVHFLLIGADFNISFV